jgi:hypothetical protein
MMRFLNVRDRSQELDAVVRYIRILWVDEKRAHIGKEGGTKGHVMWLRTGGLPQLPQIKGFNYQGT